MVYRKKVTVVLSAFSHTLCVFLLVSNSTEVTQMLAAETETWPAHTPPAPYRPWAIGIYTIYPELMSGTGNLTFFNRACKAETL